MQVYHQVITPDYWNTSPWGKYSSTRRELVLLTTLSWKFKICQKPKPNNEDAPACLDDRSRGVKVRSADYLIFSSRFTTAAMSLTVLLVTCVQTFGLPRVLRGDYSIWTTCWVDRSANLTRAFLETFYAWNPNELTSMIFWMQIKSFEKWLCFGADLCSINFRSADNFDSKMSRCPKSIK